MGKVLSKKEIREVISILDKRFPDARAELDHTNSFELLIATILSAQCTDVRVNKITSELFKKFKTPEDYLSVTQEELGEEIRSCGFYNMKSKSIQGTSKMLIEDFNGEIPDNLKDLMKLPGVGRKTANVVLSNAFDEPAIAVDTHVFRISNRIGLANAKDVLDTEKQLMENIDRELWTKSHNLMIFHGRRICRARNPACINEPEECPVLEYCSYYKENYK